MVSHQAVRVERPTHALTGFEQTIDERLSGAGLGKKVLPIIATIQDVIDRSGEFDAGFASHIARQRGAKLRVNYKGKGLTPLFGKNYNCVCKEVLLRFLVTAVVFLAGGDGERDLILFRR